MHSEKTNLWVERATHLLLLAFYIWLAYQVPYTHDDWDWGLQIGLERWLKASLNSRYVGNFFAVVLTRSILGKTLILGVTFFAIPFLIAKISCRDKSRFYSVFLLSTVLILTMPRSVWQQTYGWVSGFSNFCLSACFLLIYLWLNRLVFEKNKLAYSRASVIISIPFCISMQLFIENLAVFNILFSLYLLAYVWVTRKHVYAFHMLTFLSFLFGSIFMFSSSIFTSLMGTGRALGGIRCLTFHPSDSIVMILSKLSDRYITDISPLLFENNWILCISISFLCLLLILRGGRYKAWIPGIFSAVFIGYGAFCVLRKISPRWTIVADEKLNFLLFALISALFFAAVCLCILLYLDDGRLKAKLLIFFVSAPAVVLPILVVDTVGPRIFFTSNVFFILFCITLAAELMPPKKAITLKAGLAMICVTGILIINLGSIYLDIGRCDRLRKQIIVWSADVGATTITLPTDTHRNYWWGFNPTADWRLTCFKEFYDIPAKTKVEFK